jgi:hypothetical protein
LIVKLVTSLQCELECTRLWVIGHKETGADWFGKVDLRMAVRSARWAGTAPIVSSAYKDDAAKPCKAVNIILALFSSMLALICF